VCSSDLKENHRDRHDDESNQKDDVRKS
jgi:hypothetical protein